MERRRADLSRLPVLAELLLYLPPIPLCAPPNLKPPNFQSRKPPKAAFPEMNFAYKKDIVFGVLTIEG